MRRPLSLIAGVVALTTVISGCNLLDSSGKSSSSQTTASQAKPTQKIDPNNLPVAYYNKDDHKLFANAPTSPDRTSISSDAKPKGFTDAPAGEGLQRYLDQKISWEKCDEKFECGSVKVPLNWDEPDGQAITLAMKKLPASGTKKGTMFINPGGPGGSGQDYVTGFDAKGFPDYDIIGWDPRGSGESTPVVCADDAAMDKYNSVDISPDDEQEFTALEKAQKDFARWCRDNSGPLLDHISTIDNVRDLDYLRHLVGDKKLTYMGVSYGTLIGSIYAELYPKRAGRLVLDSAVNITDRDSVIQQMGFDLALTQFGDWCAQQGRLLCPYGSTGEQVVTNIAEWFAALDSRPIKDLDQNRGVLGVAAFLYSGKEAYSTLLTAIRMARQLNEPKYLVMAAELLMGKDERGNYTPMAFSFPAISCADSPDEGKGSVVKDWKDAEQKAPVFGKYMGPGLTCTYWSAKPMDPLEITAKGADPILVLGATGDPATPYQQSQWMASQLESGHLVTWKGAGHGVYSLGNQCAKDAVEKFINDGKVPVDGLTC